MASRTVMRDFLLPLTGPVQHAKPTPLSSGLGDVHVDEVLVRLLGKSPQIVHVDGVVGVVLWPGEPEAALFDFHAAQHQRIRSVNMVFPGVMLGDEELAAVRDRQAGIPQ